jgi:phosphoheptose isomerase
VKAVEDLNIDVALSWMQVIARLITRWVFNAGRNATIFGMEDLVLDFKETGDILFVISTSGNSKNVLYAATTAQARGVRLIDLNATKDSALIQIDVVQ